MLSPRDIFHPRIFVGISILWMSSLISSGGSLASPVLHVRNHNSKPSPAPVIADPSLSPSPPPPPPRPPPSLPPRSSWHPSSHTPPLSSDRMNWKKMTGLVLAAIAGLLQVVVVTYLLVKRKQMLRVVEKYEV